MKTMTTYATATTFVPMWPRVIGLPGPRRVGRARNAHIFPFADLGSAVPGRPLD